MSRNSRNRRKAAAGLAGLGSAAAIMGAGIAAMATGSVPAAAPQPDHSDVQTATLTQATTTTGDNAGFVTKPTAIPTTPVSSSPPSNTTPVLPGGTSTTQSDSKAPNPNDVLPGGGFWQSLLAPTSIPGAGNAGFSTISTTAPFGVGFNSVLPGGINFASVPSGGVGFSVPFWTGNTSPDDNKPTGISIIPFLNENFSVPIQNGGGGGFTVPDTITFPGNGGPATSTLGTAFGNFFNGVGGSGPSYTYTAPSWVTQVGGSYPGATYNPGNYFAGGPLDTLQQGLTNGIIGNSNSAASQAAGNLIDANTNAFQQIMNQFPTPAIVPFTTGTPASVGGVPGLNPMSASDSSGAFAPFTSGGMTPGWLNNLFPPAPGTTPAPSSVAPGGNGDKSSEVQAPAAPVQTTEVQAPAAPVQTTEVQAPAAPVQTTEVQAPAAPVQTTEVQAPAAPVQTAPVQTAQVQPPQVQDLPTEEDPPAQSFVVVDAGGGGYFG
jgi:hypothetical protein